MCHILYRDLREAAYGQRERGGRGSAEAGKSTKCYFVVKVRERATRESTYSDGRSDDDSSSGVGARGAQDVVNKKGDNDSRGQPLARAAAPRPTAQINRIK
ncbi:hypothetical protein EVAR_35279_1 [Eumeta japonica]|uniref:Uncharacterized protein n=1 Tax=Eumeta variegata TaxID=151549 RepID=A0A4C1VDI6_EUMVA|nr:hypothetical protein EVAR_35279_1 [Eumeta japonica]